ncbi:MAG: glycosyltransferase [Clostridia bacterium]|nr:glycosyltransferase [Clostridia bacterium]
MKILMLTDRMDTGGAETHIAVLARGLREMGCHVTVLSAGGRLSAALEAEGIRQLRLPVGTHNPFRWAYLRRELKKHVRRERYDILHAHARIPAFLMRGMKKYGCAEIVTVHAHFKSSPLLRRLCHWGGQTIAVSEDLRAYVCDTYGIPAEAVHVIANGIDCTRFVPQNRVFSTDAVPKTRILFASRLDRDCARGARLLCRIAPALAAQFPDLQIAIAGGGDALEEIHALANAANAASGREAVTLLGAVSDMSALLPRQDVFVGVSRAAMEAAACGCAVVLCGDEGYGGILRASSARAASLSNFCCRDCPAADGERLQSDLVFLLTHPDARATCAAEGREAVLERFDSVRMCRQTLALYHRALPPSGKKAIAVGGYFGCGNVGDDLILRGLLTALRDTDPTLRVTALTGHPRTDARRFGIPCRARKNPFSVARTLLRADVFLCGGGSLLQNATSNRSLAYYLHLLRAARLLGARPILYAAGLGPLRGARARKKAAKTLSRCPYISLRDPASFRLSGRLGLDRARLHTSADPALFLPSPPDTRASFLLREAGLGETDRFFCVVLKGGRSTVDACRMCAAAARMIARRYALTPVFLVFDPTHDAHATRVAASVLGARVLRLREGADATAILSRAQCVLTMRLHAMILATAVGTPALGVCTDPRDEKIPAFARESAQYAIVRSELSVGALVEQTEDLLSHRDAMRPVLQDAAADLRKKAKKDLENILAMLYNNK